MVKIKDRFNPKDGILCEAATVEEAVMILKNKPGIIAGADFSGLVFPPDTDMRGMSFFECCFDKTNLCGAQFVNCDLWACTFMDAQLLGTNFYFTDFYGPDVINLGQSQEEAKIGGLYVAFRGSVEPMVSINRDFQPLSHWMAEFPGFWTLTDAASVEAVKQAPAYVVEHCMRLDFIKRAAQLRGWPDTPLITI